jgi:hypothetical protein
MNSFDNLFEVTATKGRSTGSMTIKCPCWVQEQGDMEDNVMIGTYISFVEPYETLYVVNLDWFTNEKQGDLKDQNWVLREIPVLDYDRAYLWVHVGDSKRVPDNEDDLNMFYDKCWDNFKNKNQTMFVSENGVVAPLKEQTEENIRYSVLYNRNEIVGFYVDLVPEPNEESDESSFSEDICRRCASCSCRR